MTFHLRFRFKCAKYVAAGVALGCFAVVHVARAEVNAAQASFDRGLESMRNGDYETACPSLQHSYELERLPGVLFTLAECEAAWGKVATAIEHYEQFANELPSLPPERRANYEERRGIALQKIAALSAIVPFITIDVAGPAPAELVIKRNGTTIERASYGVSKPVDPGEYEIVAELGGSERWRRHVRLDERDRARIEVPWPFSDTPSPPAQEEQAAPQPGVDEGPASDERPSNLLRYVAGGVGVAGLVTATVAGSIALSQKGVIERNCPDRRCNSDGREAVATGQRAALVSTLGFAVGLAGVAGFVAFPLLYPETDGQELAERRRTRLRASAGGGADWAFVDIRGEF